MGLIDQFESLDTSVKVAIVIGLALAIPIILLVLVAVVVIVAGIIGAFTLGLGEGVDATPQASFDVHQHAEGAQITHDGGDAIESSNLYVAIDDERQPWTAYSSDSTVRVGDSITVAAESGQTVNVVYDDGENRATLARMIVG